MPNENDETQLDLVLLAVHDPNSTNDKEFNVKFNYLRAPIYKGGKWTIALKEVTRCNLRTTGHILSFIERLCSLREVRKFVL